LWFEMGEFFLIYLPFNQKSKIRCSVFLLRLLGEITRIKLTVQEFQGAGGWGSRAMKHIKDKALRLIDYLTELARLRSKIIREIRQYQSVLWIIKYDEPILDEIPGICEKWVDRSTLRNTKDIPELLSNINIQVEERNPEAEPNTPQEEQFIPVNKNLLLNDHPEVSEAWEEFVDSKWISWADLHKRWQSVQKVYAKLFSIYQEQQKLGEEYELILGLGFLSWRTPSGQATRRHLVTAKASLTFEAKLGKFIVMPAADGAQLTAEFDMLDIEDQPHHARQTAQEGLLSADDNPWDRSSVESVLKAIANSLADRGQGEYHETLKQNQRRVQEKPIVEYAPALVLRKRSVKGLEQTLKKMREQIESGGEIPVEFIDLCEGDIERESNSDEYRHNNTEVDPKIYFPKPSNEEQRQIILKLQSATGVLVQGPPGTGKSHTIANPITAKTPRALQVLHDKLPKEIRHLCISLLGSGIDEQRSLESSISSILNRQDRWNDNLEANKTNELESKIQKLESEKAEINYRIRSIRESETLQQNIINGMYLGTAAKIALRLKEDSETFCWFEDNIGYDQELLLSSSEIEAMHEDLSLLKPELEVELQLVLPDTEKDVPSQDDFTHIVNQHVKAKNDFSSKQHLLNSHMARTLIKEPSADIKQILESVSELSDSVSNIGKRPMAWIKSAVFDVLAGNNIQWKDLLHVLSERMSGLKDRAKKIDGLKVTIPDDFDRKKALLDAKILKKHFNAGGKNGWWIFKSKGIRNCRYINRDICIDSRPCSSYENLELLIEILSVEDTVDYCWNLWQDKTEKSQGPTFLQVSELEELLKALTDVVSLCDLLEVSKEALSHSQGLAGEVVWHDPETVNKLLDTCRTVISRNHFNAIQLKLQQYIQKIESIAGLPNAHPVANEALTNKKEGNTKSYPDLLAKINELNER